MKKLILSAFIAAVGAGRLCAATAEDSKIFTPYFDMSLGQAAYVPAQGNIFTGGNINTQVGLLAKVTQDDHLFGLYNFNYSGAGFTPQESKQFMDRNMTHSFTVEYRRSLGEKWRIRPGISVGHDYSRTGSAADWKTGLYNTDTRGLQLAADYTFDFDRNGVVSLTYLNRKVEFPNYTDLMAEFQDSGSRGSLDGGLNDQTFNQVSLRPVWGKFYAGLTYTWQDFKNQKVVEDSGVYGGTKQKDTNTTLDFGFHQKLWIFELYPTVGYTQHRSNQNFLRYKFLGAVPSGGGLTDGASDVTFVAKNYDYNETTLSVPLDLNITSKWAIGGAFNMISREYTDRQKRDSSNNYIGGKQKNLMTTMTGSIRKRINETAMVRLYYGLTVATSNNKFEKYTPNNYTGNTFGIAYQLSY